MLGNLMFTVVSLDIGCPSSTPQSCKIKLGEKLKKYGYDIGFIDNLNADMVIGYYTAKEIVKDIASDYIHAAFDTINKEDDNVLAREMEIGVVRNVMCEMIALKISSFSTLEKAHKKLREILEKYEYDETFIEGVNSDITSGFNLGIDMLMEAINNYLHRLENVNPKTIE